MDILKNKATALGYDVLFMCVLGHKAIQKPEKPIRHPLLYHPFSSLVQALSLNLGLLF